MNRENLILIAAEERFLVECLKCSFKFIARYEKERCLQCGWEKFKFLRHLTKEEIRTQKIIDKIFDEKILAEKFRKITEKRH